MKTIASRGSPSLYRMMPQRRDVLGRALLAVAASTLPALAPLRASALVDGIPLYAPGDKISLPEAGFEVWLPRMEAIRDVQLPALRAAADASDWPTVEAALSPSVLKEQLTTFGNLASILGDEAYTAVGIKALYTASAKKLQASVGKRDDALKRVGELELCVTQTLALVPAPVVQQVREREAKLRRLRGEAAAGEGAAAAAAPVDATAAADAAPAPSAPAPPATQQQQPGGGLLMTPNGPGQLVCGRDIRC